MISENEKESTTQQIIGDICFACSNINRICIAKHIQKNEEAKFGNIRYEFNLNNNSLTFHLKKLKKSYIISKTENGTYKLGMLGEPALDNYDKLVEDIYQFLESNPEYL